MENLTIDLVAINNIPMVLKSVLSELQELKQAFHETKTSSQEQNKFLTIKEASKYLDVSESGLYQAIHYGKIPYYKPNGKRVYFLKQDLDKWIIESRCKSALELDKEAGIISSRLASKK